MPVDIQVAPYEGIWRGLMQRRRGVDHPELYASEALNVELSGNVLSKRLGLKLLNATSSPYGNATSHRIYALYYVRWRYNTGGPDELLIAAGAMIQRQADPPGPDIVTPATLPPTTPARAVPQYAVQFTQYNNQVFIVDGTNENLKLYQRGGVETIGVVGIDPPTARPGLSLTTAPPPTGVGLSPATGYRYRYTYLNSFTQAESDASDESPNFDSGAPSYIPNPPIKPVNQQVVVTWTASPDPQVDKVRIYRTLDGGETYGFLAEAAVTAANYTDQTPDTKIDDTAYEENKNTPPPSPLKLIVPWVQANRLLGVSRDQPSILYYSDLNLGFLKPESWPPENMIFVARDAGDEIIALFPFTDSVLVFGRRSTFRLRGIPPDDLTLEPVQYEDDMRTAVGTLAQKALIQVDDSLINPYLDGAYAVDRFVDTQGGFTNNRLSRPIDGLWQQLSPGAVQWSHGIFVRSRKQIRLWVPHDGRSVPDRALIYQLDVSATANEPAGWTVWEFCPPAGGTDAQITASVIVETQLVGDVAYIGTADGYLGQMDEGVNDWWYDAPGPTLPIPGKTYSFVWQSVPVYLAEDQRLTRLRFVDLVWAADTITTLVCTPVTQFDIDWPAIVFRLSPVGAFILDIDQLDIGKLGPDQIRVEMRGSGLTLGALHALRWRVDQDAEFQIEKWRVLFQPVAQKARYVEAIQALPSFDEAIGFGGEGIWGFGEGPFGGRYP